MPVTADAHTIATHLGLLAAVEANEIRADDVDPAFLDPDTGAQALCDAFGNAATNMRLTFRGRHSPPDPLKGETWKKWDRASLVWLDLESLAHQQANPLRIFRKQQRARDGGKDNRSTDYASLSYIEPLE